MSLLWLDSFDHYVSADMGEKYTSTSSPTIEASGGRFSTNSFRSSGGAVKGLAAASGTTFIFGFAYKPPTILGTQDILIVGNGGTAASTAHFSISTLPDGSLTTRRGNNTAPTLGTSAAGLLSGGTYGHLEVKVLIDDTVGTVELRWNGVAVLTLTGQDTKGTPAAAWNIFEILTGGGGSGMDDLYVCDGTGSVNNDFLGDCRVECLLPSTGNGTNTGLTCSTGSDHGALVDETAPNDDTDYNSGVTAGLKDTYNFPALATTGDVKGVQVCVSVKKSDSGTKTVAPVTRSAGTDYDGTTVPVPSTSYVYVTQILEEDPATTDPWTVSGVNAAEFGLKVVA